MNPEFIKASEVRLIPYQFYNILHPLLRSKFIIPSPSYIDLDLFGRDSFKNDSATPASSEFKKSFTNFTKAYNDCFREVQRMR